MGINKSIEKKVVLTNISKENKYNQYNKVEAPKEDEKLETIDPVGDDQTYNNCKMMAKLLRSTGFDICTSTFRTKNGMVSIDEIKSYKDVNVYMCRIKEVGKVYGKDAKFLE